MGTPPPGALFENGKTENEVACNQVWGPKTISFVRGFGPRTWLHATSFSVFQFFFGRARDLLGPPLGRVDGLVGAVVFRARLGLGAAPVQDLAPAGLPGLPRAGGRRPIVVRPLGF